jgi:calcineurin-like phosphoesterase family protein/flagellar hook capping protein FlgD
LRAPNLVVCAICALPILLAAPPAGAWTYGDTLTVIWRPLPNLPAFARPGDTFTVWANAGPGVSGWSATLRFGDLVVPLAPAGGGYQATRGRWELGFTVPAGTPEEIYDLGLTSGGTLPDIASHAVKVITAYRSDFYFAQISDTHLPGHAFSSGGVIDTADTTGMADFDAVIGDLNVIHPEFILHTGDLVNEGELEEYLGMYEMGRAQQMMSRLFSPIFVVSGNHDIGGWKPTAPPDGTARKNWWRQFGWPFLANPPGGDPYHSQDFSFDYGLLHVIGLEGYINNGSYDSYLPGIWGAQSMSQEQMNWLAADVAAVPAGRTKLAFFHYDFGGTLANGQPAPNFSQFNNPGALGLDGVLWGHHHGVAEGNRAAKPFNLGLQAVIDGRRTFRIFRVSNGVVTPGPMHHSGGSSGTPTDSLVPAWSGPNDGTRSRLTATVLNRFGEAWEHARLLFVLVDHDSSFAATGGTIAQTVRHGGRVNVYVDCTLPAGATTVVSVAADLPIPVGVAGAIANAIDLEPPAPSPFRPGAGPLTVRFGLRRAGRVTVTVMDVAGRHIARVFEGPQEAGVRTLTWSGRGQGGAVLPAGVYLVRLETEEGGRSRRFVLVK